MALDRSDIFFVYGALRSGTTVFRLMLNAHPRMSNPGEMDFLFDHLLPDTSHPTGWRYQIDALRAGRIFKKQRLDIAAGMDGLDLLNSFLDQLQARALGQVLSINIHRSVDRMLQVLPHAPIIHMLRDPRDVARSSIGMGWVGTLYHGVGHWIETEQAWDDATLNIAKQQIEEFTYEDLFRRTERTLRAVCSFMHCDYDPAMLQYHENTTYGPPDPKLTEQWRRKSTPRELMDVEFRAGPMMQRRGYTPAYPRTPAPITRRIALGLTNKIAVWKFGIRRFGFVIFWAEKVTRWARMRGLHRSFKEQMDQITIQHLK
ncbi:sulfotransferase [Tateyamaria sp. ANG-S1]|uniref:sulfotransferase family protein n=1 Tax=Tateyamaria sp. ANG-S1 TaxID=1577905 RepID=UPI00057C6EBA|nr:sulfotransferase [Tateyamaria sp. ANG-S1]KIC45462.1 hypothetical protein RA29_20695 [Tateyamaria sp. ANG-S1]